MNRTQFHPRTHRTKAAVETLSHDYPECWAQLDMFRAAKGAPDLGTWPDWCYLPMAAAYAVVSQGGAMPAGRAGDVARVAALAAWRMTQGIYRFDPAVYDAMRATPVAGDIPHSVLYRLPEWCVYIETPGMRVGDAPLHGAWAHLEHDMGNGRAELRLLLDMDARLLPIPLHLGAWPLSESISRMMDTSAGIALARGGAPVPRELAGPLHEVAEPIVSLLLYLCSQAAEIESGQRRPSNPEPKRTKRGWRLFQADRPTTWDVGVRLGTALRRAYQAEQTGQGGEHAGPRPHIRRAHWHTILSGPRLRDDGSAIPPAERRADLRWMPPIPVNVDDAGELPAVVRPVK